MQDMLAHVERLGVNVIFDHIEKAALTAGSLQLAGSHHYSCDALVIATGASAQYLGLPSEQQFLGKGVSACATCDGFFYRGKRVAVIGGGNTAVEEALYLANLAEKVTLVHRRDALRAEKILQERLFAREREGRVEIRWNCVLDEVIGDNSGVTGMRCAASTVIGRKLSISRAYSSPSGTNPTPISFSDSSICRVATSPRAAARTATRRRPAFPASSPPAMSPITSTARRSPPRASAVWLPWMRKSTSTNWPAAMAERRWSR
jgi:NADH dehydrogenase FAD-containing subunit